MTSVWIFKILVLLGFSLTIIGESLQIFPRIAGGIVLKPASGFNYASQILLINRLGSTIYLFSASVLVDSNISSLSISRLFASSLCLTSAAFLLILIFFRKLLMGTLKFFQCETAGKSSFFRDINSSLDANVNEKFSRKLFFAIVVTASFFSYIGLSLPFLTASIFHSVRLTISQLGVFGNLIFTLSSVFYIDRVIASLSDSKNINLCDYGLLFLKGRAVSALLCIAVYLLIGRVL